MKSQILKFKLIDRGFKGFLVLIPGWATDYRIFSNLDLDYNYLSPLNFDPFNFNSNLTSFLKKESINKVSVFGWSLGGFLAQEFAINNPDMVDELVLVSVRRKYELNTLKDTRAQILKNKKAFLCKFYLNFFSDKDKEGLLWFKNNLLIDYCKKMDLTELIAGLDYLAQARIKTDSLARFKKLRIFHGEKDPIAPFYETREIKNNLPSAVLINIPGAGHAPFLNKNFREMFYG